MIEFNNCKISGIAAAVPKTIIDNAAEHNDIDSEEVSKTIKLTGVEKYRRSEPNICSSDLCCAAAINLFEELKIDSESIDAVIFVSQTPDYKMPSTACLLQHRLKCRTDIVAYDINLGCSGFVFGLFTVCSFLAAANFSRVLLLCGDTQTKITSPSDKNVRFILGDAGTATLIERSEGVDPIRMVLSTDGSRYNSLMIPAGGCRTPSTSDTVKLKPQQDGQIRSDEHIYMSGLDVFNFSVTDVVRSIQKFLEHPANTDSHFDYLVLHQANKFMIDKIGRKLKFDKSEILYSLNDYGNTSCASIPLTIVNNYDAFSGSKKNILMSGFGVGLSWGVVNLALDKIKCPPILEI